MNHNEIMSVTTIDEKGRVLIPLSIRKSLNLKFNERLSIELLKDGIKLRVIKADVAGDPLFKDFANPAHVRPSLVKKEVLDKFEEEQFC